MSHFQKIIIISMGFLMSLVQLVQWLMIPSSQSMTSQEEVVCTATTMVTKRVYTKNLGFRDRYYIKYVAGEYSVLEQVTEKGHASVAVTLKEKKDFTLYKFKNKSSLYRLVETGVTLEEALQEERKPFMIWTGVYFALGVYFYYRFFILQ